MQLFRTLIALSTLAALTFSACADETIQVDAKPSADPDIALGIGKLDVLTDWYVTQQGFFALGDNGGGHIAYPTWFNGHLVELTAGQTVNLYASAQDRSLVRIYGPATGMWDGEYLFDRAELRKRTRRDGEIFSVSVDFEVEENGVYMLVMGPLAVWETNYKFRMECVAGCGDDEMRCEDDLDCADDQFCGHNGVYCITAPCEAAFNTCQKPNDAGDSCHRDEMCAQGLACIDDVCAESTTCDSDDDCNDGWCACADGSCSVHECKAWAQEGQGCGGRVMPEFVSRCGPELQCIGRGLAYDAPGVCAITVEVTALQADPEQYDGKFIATEGYIDASYAICTQMACGFDNACCNSCGADQQLFHDMADVSQIEGISLKQDGEQWSCGGNECTWQDSCTVETGAYWIGGKFVVGQYGQQTLEVEHYWSL